MTPGVSKSNGQDNLYDWHNDTRCKQQQWTGQPSTTGTMTPGVSKSNGQDNPYDWHNDTRGK